MFSFKQMMDQSMPKAKNPKLEKPKTLCDDFFDTIVDETNKDFGNNILSNTSLLNDYCHNSQYINYKLKHNIPYHSAQKKNNNINKQKMKNLLREYTKPHNTVKLEKHAFWITIKKWSKIHANVFNQLTAKEKEFKVKRCCEFIAMNCDYIKNFPEIEVKDLQKNVLKSMKNLETNEEKQWLTQSRYLTQMHIQIMKDLYLNSNGNYIYKAPYVKLLGCVINLLSSFVKWAAKSDLLSKNVQTTVQMLYIHCVCPCEFISISSKSLRAHLHVHLKKGYLNEIDEFYQKTENPVPQILMNEFKHALFNNKK